MSTKISNEVLLEELAFAHECGEVTAHLSDIFESMITAYSNRAHYSGYTEPLKNGMQVQAFMECTKYWHTFDSTKSQNPFAYFAHVIQNAFLRYLSHHKKSGIV